MQPGFVFSAASTWVIYRADQESDEVTELFQVPLAGGAATKLNGPLVTGGDVQPGPQASSDNNWVIYRANQDTAQAIELFKVPLAGGTATRLNGALPAGGNVQSFQISPDSGTVVYLAN